jgi:hypothetical protein
LDLEIGGSARPERILDTQVANEHSKPHQYQPGEVGTSLMSDANASGEETEKCLKVEADVGAVHGLTVPASAALVTVFQRMSEAQRILKTHQLGYYYYYYCYYYCH